MQNQQDVVSRTLLSGKCENDQNHTFSLGIYYKPTMKKGKLQFNIFKKGEGRPLCSIPFSQAWIVETKVVWEQLLKNFAKGKKESFSITESHYDRNAKKYETKQIGNLVYGFDTDVGKPFIGLAYEKQLFKCPLDVGGLIDKSIIRTQDYLTPETEREILVKSFIEVLNQALYWMTKSIFLPKEDPPRNNAPQSSSSSQADIEDQIPF